MLFGNKLPLRVAFVVFHLIVGTLAGSLPQLVGYFYLLATAWFIVDVVRTSDADSRAGFYALYLMGFEVVYRIAGTNISYEFGKYACLLVLVVGVIFGKRNYFPWMFVILLVLLLPSIFLSQSEEPGRVREMIMFNMSGPLTLVASGLYFYRRPIEKQVLLRGLSVAFFPAFALIAALTVKSGISTIEFSSLESNPAATGGFGANQVSTVLGWFILLLLMVRVMGNKVTPFELLDWVMLGFLVVRGLLSMSRGGMMGAVIALLLALVAYLFADSGFRHKAMKSLPYVGVGLFFVVGVVFYVNTLTDNFLLYRYQGKSTSEVMTGDVKENQGFLTGRDDIMRGDWVAFTQYPILGVGYGMANKYHAIYFGHEAAAHTEYARLLSEHGLMGVLFMLVAFILLPLVLFFKLSQGLSRFVFLAFIVISMATMFHAAMRLALPGVLFGAAFMVVFDKKNIRLGGELG